MRSGGNGMTQAHKLHSVALNLEPTQFLAGWRQDHGTLFLPTLSEARVGDEVAVRIGIFGQAIRATVLGTIGLVRRMGRPSLPPGVELTLDPGSLPAAAFLAAAARGEKVTFRERAPRYVISRPVRVLRDGLEVEARSLNLSDGGVAVGWTGPLPMVGEVLELKLGTSFLAPRARSVVCWNSLGGNAHRAVGLRILAGGRAARAWRTIAAEAARSGAPTA
jgi:Tfp pilus assembly protein PilZ